MKAATELARELLAASGPDANTRDPFVEAIVTGRLSRESVRRYALALVGIASAFPHRIADVLSICDHSEVRALLIGNLLEEEGVVSYDPANGLRIDEERSHSALASRFARASGASDAEVATAIVAARPARWFVDAVQRGDWLGAFAYFAIGHEANVPGTFRQITPPLNEHYGFPLEDLIFLTEHFAADERHGTQSAHMIGRIAGTQEDVHRALEGARRGGAAWRAWPRTCLGRDSMSPMIATPRAPLGA